ncbi:Nitrogen permease regulator 3, partial [Ascosphaera acerosa]
PGHTAPMSATVRPPNPSLVAIIVIVKTRAGPRFVFHYPPQPDAGATASARRSSRAKGRNTTGPASDDSDADADAESHSSSGDESSSDESLSERRASWGARLSRSFGDHHRRSGGAWADAADGLRPASGKYGSSASLQQLQHQHQHQHHQHHHHRRGAGAETDDGSSQDSEHDSQPSWESLFGLKTFVWEKLLCPAESFRKRKFEVGINDLAFVGWPVFVKPDGTWGRVKGKHTKRHEHGDAPAGEHGQARVSGVAEQLHNAKEGEGQKSASASSTSPPPSSSENELVMFNVVFVLNPPALEYNLRLRDQYDNVVKKFGKGLRAEQARVGYVWEQVQTIMRVKDRARQNRSSMQDLYHDLRGASSLVRAISTVYENISQSRIASIRLSPETTMSLQIPPLTSTSELPLPGEPSCPGLWLTSVETLGSNVHANMYDADGLDRPAVLAKHFALLLLVDEHQVLKDIDTSTTFGARLAQYVQVSKPNKSFAQISAMSGISLSDVQIFAGHLVYWRRARAIPPLNQQDTYIVSPNADLRQLSTAAAAYKRAFPTMPSLSKMLSLLSGPPRPYSTFIPTRDHKEVYYSILAWLMRGGWVTQLRTFAWVKASPAIKLAAEARPGAGDADSEVKDSSGDHGNAGSPDTGCSGSAHDAGAAEPMEPRQKGPGSPIQTSVGTDSSSVPEDLNRAGGVSISLQPAAVGDTGAMKPRADLLYSSLILKPYRASAAEMRWLEEIQLRLPYLPPSQTRVTPQSNQHPGTSHEGPVLDHLRAAESAARADGSPFRTAAVASSQASGVATPGAPDQDEDKLKKSWAMFIKYFNGIDAIESIAVREGMKKKVVRRLLLALDQGVPAGADIAGSADLKQGNGPRESVLVKVRHW